MENVNVRLEPFNSRSKRTAVQQLKMNVDGIIAVMKTFQVNYFEAERIQIRNREIDRMDEGGSDGGTGCGRMA